MNLGVHIPLDVGCYDSPLYYEFLGVPYTQTSGIQEAIDYLKSIPNFSYRNPGYVVQLLHGNFYINSDVSVYTPGGNVNNISIRGMGRNCSTIIINKSGMNGLVITPLGTNGEGLTFQDVDIYLSENLSPNTVNSLVVLPSNAGTKVVFINCKINTVGNANFSNTNILVNGGIYNANEGQDTRLSFIGCTLNGANVYNDSSNNNVSFIACDFNQGLNVNVTAIYRSAYYFATMQFVGSNINAHIQLQGNRTIMMSVYGGNIGGEIYVTSGYHFIRIGDIYWDYSTGDTSYISISSGATLSSLIIENVYFPGSNINLVNQSGTVNYFKFTTANASSSTIPTINVSVNVVNPASVPVSGTPYQNTNGYDILIYLPVYTSTSGTAGNVKASVGASSSSLTQVINEIINSGTSSSNPRTIILKVPAGWWYEFVGTTVTFATSEVVAD